MPGSPKIKSTDFVDDPASLARLPEENPNPVLRINTDGGLRYANSAAQALFASAGREAAFSHLVANAALARNEKRTIDADFDFDGEIYSMSLMPVADRDYTNVFGRNVTAERKAQHDVRDLAKFPSENPNPVMRSDREGRVVFANAFAQVLSELTVTSRTVGWFFLEQLRFAFMPVFHGVQGRLATQG